VVIGGCARCSILSCCHHTCIIIQLPAWVELLQTALNRMFLIDRKVTKKHVQWFIFVCCRCSINLKPPKKKTASPFVKIVGPEEEELGKTKVVQDNLFPKWNDDFSLDVMVGFHASNNSTTCPPLILQCFRKGMDVTSIRLEIMDGTSKRHPESLGAVVLRLSDLAPSVTVSSLQFLVRPPMCMCVCVHHMLISMQRCLALPLSTQSPTRWTSGCRWRPRRSAPCLKEWCTSASESTPSSAPSQGGQEVTPPFSCWADHALTMH
jgi:hypothetical protein